MPASGLPPACLWPAYGPLLFLSPTLAIYYLGYCLIGSGSERIHIKISDENLWIMNNRIYGYSAFKKIRSDKSGK